MYSNPLFRAIQIMVLVAALLGVYQNCSHQSGGLDGSDLSSAGTAPFADKEIIVRMEDSSSDQEFRQYATGQGLQLENDWSDFQLTHWSWEAELTVAEVQDLIQEQSFAGKVLYAEPNYLLAKTEVESPDEIQPLSWDEVVPLLSPGENNQTDSNVGLTEIWPTIPQGRPKVVVAVIDSGIDLTHRIFNDANALWENSDEIPGNGRDDDGNGYVDDVQGWNFVNNTNDPTDDDGHGTHCAGIVLGVGQDIFADPGNVTESLIEIMPLKFLSRNGGSTAAAINAVIYAVNNGADVLSNSWGGPGPSTALEDAMIFAYERGTVFVAAAGNTTDNIDVSPVYPAVFKVPNVLTIAANTSSDRLATFSNFGPRTVDLASPGVSILSTYPVDRYARLSGTSMATPFVAGTAALMKYLRPEMNGFQIKNIIIEESVDVNVLGPQLINAKRLNAFQAVARSENEPLNTSMPPYRRSSGISSSDEGAGGGCGSVSSIPPPPPGSAGMLALFLLLPLLILIRQKKRALAQR